MKQPRSTGAWTDRDGALLYPDCMSKVRSGVSEKEPGAEILEVLRARSRIVEVGYDTEVSVKTSSGSVYRLLVWFDLERFHVKEIERLLCK